MPYRPFEVVRQIPNRCAGLTTLQQYEQSTPVRGCGSNVWARVGIFIASNAKRGQAPKHEQLTFDSRNRASDLNCLSCNRRRPRNQCAGLSTTFGTLRSSRERRVNNLRFHGFDPERRRADISGFQPKARGTFSGLRTIGTSPLNACHTILAVVIQSALTTRLGLSLVS